MEPSEKLSREETANRLQSVRSLTRDVVADLDEAQLLVPVRQTLNPFLWELGHVAYFWEAFVLRPLGLEGELIVGVQVPAEPISGNRSGLN